MSLPQRIYVLPARQTRPAMQQHVAPRQVVKRSFQPPTEQLVAELLGDDMGPCGPRKRERLTHLSQEEKMDRRKLKNRVAAQNARDKKKERSAKIEDVMRDLVEENRRLRTENETLRRQNEQLLIEREEQEQKPMEMVYVETNTGNDENIYSNVVYEEEVVGEVEDRAFESAAFINVPLPWEQARSASRTRCTDSSKKTISVDTYLTIVSILCNHMDQLKTNTLNESSKLSKYASPRAQRIIFSDFQSPPGEFDRFIAGCIEEGTDYASSSSDGFCSSSETRETLSPGSLALSPSTSYSSTDWDDDSFLNYQTTATTTTDDSLTDPGNWNFETFDENSIDLNFFQNV